ncbi:unnamed protein product [Arctogadus glacialis]
MPACVEPVGVAVWSIDSPERAPRFNQQWHQKKYTNVKMPMGDVQCHICSSLGHMMRNCPSPRRPRQQARTVNKNTAPDTGMCCPSISSTPFPQSPDPQ